MSKDAKMLFEKIGMSFELLELNSKYIIELLDNLSFESALHDAYLNTKDSFDLLIQCRALRDMLLDELAQARYERDNGDII